MITQRIGRMVLVLLLGGTLLSCGHDRPTDPTGYRQTENVKVATTPSEEACSTWDREFPRPEPVEPVCFPRLPAPELTVLSKDVEATYTRYWMTVANWQAFPVLLFAPAPHLPPCGINPNAARTWTYVYAANGSYLYGYCGWGTGEYLRHFWFSVPHGYAPPEYVYIVLEDRECGIEYVSNLASTDVGSSGE